MDRVGNRTILTETLIGVLDIPPAAYLENNGQVVLEAENGQIIAGLTHAWLTSTAISGYTGTAYLHALPDTDAFYPTAAITDSPKVEYLIHFTTPATYTVWVRGYADNADADAVNVALGDQVVDVTGFAPEEWNWANQSASGGPAKVVVETSGVYTLNLLMREDGMRVDRLLLTTDTTFIPSAFGPAESEQQGTSGGPIVLLDRTIVYTYDHLYRLTDADYSTRSAGSGQAGELYEYDYDPVGNRLQQIINGDTTEYLYDAANRLEAVDGQSYTFDANGNLLATGVMTNSWDAANRLVETAVSSQPLGISYDGLGNRVAQTVGATTTYFALDVVGLPEVIQTNEGNTYLHLPGVIVAESAGGEVRYLLSDGLGSVRQAVDEAEEVVASYEFDPYGNPVDNDGGEPYGYTGEWWEDEVGLLHLRARWYLPETGTFLSRDPVESDPAYLYVRGNPVNFTDPSGYQAEREIYGVSISSEFDQVEQGLIEETIKEYANLLGGTSTFQKNVLLTRVEKIPVEISLVDPNSAYVLREDRSGERSGEIFLPYHLYYYQAGPGYTTRFSPFSKDMFPDVPESTFPNQEVVFKFVLAHEMTHALETGNPPIRTSFENTFSHRLYGEIILCGFPLPIKFKNRWSKDPIIKRNVSRKNYEGEVLADVVAAYLYAPSLIDNEYKDWVKNVLPTKLMK